MAKVIWSPTATRDAEAIFAYIAQDSEDHAALMVLRFLEAADRLATFPASGRVIPGAADPNAREIIVAPYRLMYKLDRDAVIIAGIVHGARRWPPQPRQT